MGVIHTILSIIYGRILCPLVLAFRGIGSYARCIARATERVLELDNDAERLQATLMAIATAATVLYSNALSEVLGIDDEDVMNVVAERVIEALEVVVSELRETDATKRLYT